MADRPGQVFGEAPALYDRFRPSYPRELVEAVVADSGNRPVLEIGAGTGKATKALIALGKKVHALEPDPRMAAVLALNCQQGGAEIVSSTLERAELPPGGYDLVVAAQSWHWVDQRSSFHRVADSLVPGGRLALLWHAPRARQGLFGQALDQLYARLAPGLVRPLPGVTGSDFAPGAADPSATDRFGDWIRLEHHWQRDLDAAGLVGWLCTSARHRMLSLGDRTETLTAVAALVDQFGGLVTVEMSTVAHLATRR